jgi:Flp pilus assembly pilin Flp
MLELYLRLRNALEPDEGQTLVEYALIIAVVSVLIVAALIALRGGIEGVFDAIVAALGQ